MIVEIPQRKVKHLLSRASFGPSPEISTINISELFKQSGRPEPLDLISIPELEQTDMKALKNNPSRREMIKELLGKSRQELMKLNLAWFDRMILNPGIREKMTFFWHGHFACRSLVPYFAQQQNNLLRESALESFETLLKDISKNAAMLQFLNNQQNRKDHPNENFAREVMELFTLGRGNYSENDIKEAARAFTGWGFNIAGQYQFRPRQHDYGTKTFRGNTKDFTGEQILDSILEDKTTAVFITRKLYTYFISDSSIDSAAIESWSNTFYKSNYNIRQLLSLIFESEQFNNPKSIGTRVKSPVDLIAGMLRHTNGKFENPQSAVFLQKALGQVLFYPPNVSGWTSGNGWIDSSSLAFRLTLPMILFGGSETDFEAMDDGDANGLGKEEKKKRRLQCHVDWDSLAKVFTKSNASETLQGIEDYLLMRPTGSNNNQIITRTTASASDDSEFIRKAFIGYMSLPEYQLC